MTRIIHRVMATYGWTPRELDEMTFSEIFNAAAMVETLRNEEVGSMMIAGRYAQADSKDFALGMKRLGFG
jgi:hypothetical protein